MEDQDIAAQLKVLEQIKSLMDQLALKGGGMKDPLAGKMDDMGGDDEEPDGDEGMTLMKLKMAKGMK